ncbi:hypothetical protein GOB86_06835 [Acetobacter lambici]|uniref:Uncharacterized protein n=1 Tax=Acetobacter lambici TaxID=1332824 RepID=A0ABT1EZP1_9PROT|nr:hypothetical protein [Acetobacter lambici]MCP1242299.1 hypothetical protein [Acetobacter lambici]MCP1258415.1 hypothetical protein [Acetobacter lambici]NHO56782.1 hypothetical protein [Acetobacter lambici]
MLSIRKIALLGLPLVAFAGTASVAHADPCLSLSGCLQQGAESQVDSAKDSVKNAGSQFTSGVRDQAKQRWNSATEAEREKLLAKGGALTSSGANATEKLNNAEKTVKDRWNNASTAERQKILAQRDKLTGAATAATAAGGVSSAEQNVKDRWNNASQSTKDAWKSKKDRLKSDVNNATTLPSIPSL